MPFEGLLDLDMQALDRLRFAREQIAKGNWCQRSAVIERGEVELRCAVGWLGWHEPANHSPVYNRASHYLWEALPRSARRSWRRPWGGVHGPSYDIASYNDRHTRQAVVKLFDRAIASMEQANGGI